MTRNKKLGLAVVDGLETQVASQTVLSQLGENITLKNIPLRLHVAEGRGDEDADLVVVYHD